MPSSRLGYLLKHAQFALAEHTGPALAPLGINGRELAVLSVLESSKALAQHEAAGRLGVDRTTMVDLVDVLQDKGLVERRPDPLDRGDCGRLRSPSEEPAPKFCRIHGFGASTDRRLRRLRLTRIPHAGFAVVRRQRPLLPLRHEVALCR